MQTLARLVQRIARALQTGGTSVSSFGRLWRTVILVPIFGGWWLLTVGYTRLRAPFEVDSITRGGRRFQCRLPDLIDMYVYLFGVWEPDLAAFIGRSLAPGRTFIDVGAHIGYFSMVGAAAVAPDGGVVGFEPNRDTYRRLLANVAINGEPAVRCVPVAIAEQDGELMLYRGPAGNSGLATSLESRGFTIGENVPARTPRDMLTESELATARLIKIDVEGAEPGVMRGFAELVPDLPADVEFVVEVSPHWWTAGDTMEAILAPYLAAGFRVYQIDNNYWPWRYLWPNVVRPPALRRDDAAGLSGRADLVLSRRVGETL